MSWLVFLDWRPKLNHSLVNEFNNYEFIITKLFSKRPMIFIMQSLFKDTLLIRKNKILLMIQFGFNGICGKTFKPDQLFTANPSMSSRD